MTLAASSRKVKIPGPRPKPVIGPMGNLLGFARDPVGFMEQVFRRYGDICSLVEGGGVRILAPFRDVPGTIFVRGPELTREVSSQHEVFYEYPLSFTLYPMAEVNGRRRALKHYGTGLFSVNSDTHRQHRRLLIPAFHKKRIEAYRSDMVAITNDELSKWQIGQQRNIHQDMLRLFMRIATKTLFGKDIGEGGEKVGQALGESLELLTNPILLVFPRDVPGTPYHRFLNLVNTVDSEISALIAEKRRSGVDGGDMLSTLLETRDEDNTQLTEDEIIGHVGVLFAAGHETSANAITWTLFLLSQHPKIAADLYDELDGVLSGDSPTMEQIAQLPLLDRVVKESLRILPPLPSKPRIVHADTQLGGYDVPAGTEVVVGMYSTHHMPEYFPEPECFNPDRWLTADPDVFTYHPFGGGPRMCIGAPFANMSIRIVLATLLQRFRLELMPNTKMERKWGVTMSTRYGLPMTVQPTDGQYTRGVGGVKGNVREMVELPN
jgi:cytochrome P450